MAAQKTSLTDAFAKQGVVWRCKQSLGKGTEARWNILACERRDEDQRDKETKVSRLVKTVKDQQKDGDFDNKPMIGGATIDLETFGQTWGGGHGPSQIRVIETCPESRDC